MYENFGLPMYNPSMQFPYQSPYRPQQSNDIQGNAIRIANVIVIKEA